MDHFVVSSGCGSALVLIDVLASLTFKPSKAEKVQWSTALIDCSQSWLQKENCRILGVRHFYVLLTFAFIFNSLATINKFC